MGLPEEDRGPAWLRDWGDRTGYTDADPLSGYVDPDALSVDIESLMTFANSLLAEQEQDFRKHVQIVFDGMSAIPAPPDGRFIELVEGMTHHRDMIIQTSTAMAHHDSAVIAFVEAARAISEEYRNADALSAASVRDVETNLAPVQTGTAPTVRQPVVVTPEQASQQTSTPVSTTTGSTGAATDNGTEYS